MYKLIAFDIDGTLVNHLENEFAPEIQDMFKKLKKNGYTIVLSTGRDFISINNLYKNEHIDYYIGANGAFIWDCKQNKYLFNSTIDFNEYKKLSENVLSRENLHLRTIILSDQNNVFVDVKEKKEPWFWDYFKSKFIDLNLANSKLDKEHFHLITIEHKTNSSILKLVNEYFKKNQSTIGVQAFWTNGIFIANKGITKAHTIKLLCEKLNIEMSEVIAFGDGENDKEMIKEVGLGIAMGNAVNELKEIADDVTIDVTKFGTKFYLEKLGLI